MTPATHLGSATPVQMGGIPGKDEEPPEEQAGKAAEKRTGETAMERKVLEDAVSYIRSLAERHGRNADWAEEAVRDAVNLNAGAALARNVVDVVAASLPELMEQIDGRTVVMAGGERTLNTQGIELERTDPDWRTRLLSVITDPNVAYILLMIGIYGLILEFYNPGVGVAGVTGLICLLIGAYALQMMPVSYAGLGLLGLGIGLMVTEALSPSFGVFGVGGIIAFIFGSVMLFDTDLPAYQISWPVIAAFATASAGLFGFAMSAVLRFRRRTPVTGEESLMGAPAEAVEDFEDHGRVHLQGEVWQARTAEPVHAGQRLRVTGREGLIVTVATQAEEDAPPATH
jgi:membrane-bound serine protease (ClpP class)